jgi:hypothetical protein
MNFALVTRVLFTSLVLAPVLVAVSSPSPSPSASADTVTPVPVITDDPYANATPPSYELSYALQEAERRAQLDPTSYGQPYIKFGEIYAPVTTIDVQGAAAQPIGLPADLTAPNDGTDDMTSVPAAQDKASVAAEPTAPAASTTGKAGGPADKSNLTAAQKTAEAASPQATTAGSPLFYPRVKLVPRSLSRLDAIKDEVVALTPDVLPGVDKVTGSFVQAELDRVIVEATEASDELRTALATRYGTDAVAVRLMTDPTPASPGSRWYDTSYGGFYGGARISTSIGVQCTDAFSWRYSGYQAMLTAGHCTGLGGGVSTLAESMGNVVKDTWNNNTGSVHIDGQSTYIGDASLIKLSSGKTSTGRIYVGPKESTLSRPVGGMWSRRPAYGDTYCTGGTTTGELCGWRVDTLRFNLRYSDGTYARNMTRGSKGGKCTDHGDSGGPVYTVDSAGKVIAKGIHSGMGGGGGDNWGGAFDPCREFFSDIWNVYYGFPGTIAIG